MAIFGDSFVKHVKRYKNKKKKNTGGLKYSNPLLSRGHCKLKYEALYTTYD